MVPSFFPLTIISTQILWVGWGIDGTARTLSLTERKKQAYIKSGWEWSSKHNARKWASRLPTFSWTWQIQSRTPAAAGRSRWLVQWQSWLRIVDRLFNTFVHTVSHCSHNDKHIFNLPVEHLQARDKAAALQLRVVSQHCCQIDRVEVTPNVYWWWWKLCCLHPVLNPVIHCKLTTSNT